MRFLKTQYFKKGALQDGSEPLPIAWRVARVTFDGKIKTGISNAPDKGVFLPISDLKLASN